jgi:hypothetical protein
MRANESIDIKSKAQSRGGSSVDGMNETERESACEYDFQNEDEGGSGAWM